MAKSEKALQQEIATFFRKKKCFVMVIQPQAGIPDGTPDVIALFPGGGWAAIEVKASPTARFQPLQKLTIKKLDEMYYSKAVYPENWPAIRAELEQLL